MDPILDQKILIKTAQYLMNLNKHDWLKIMQVPDQEHIYYALIVYNFYYSLGFPIIGDKEFDQLQLFYTEKYEYEGHPKSSNEFGNELLDKTLSYIYEQTKNKLLNIYAEKHETMTFAVDLEQTKISLPYPMPSLNKLLLKNDKNQKEQLMKWLDKYKSDNKINISIKLDGCSIMLYIKDKQIYLYTRGDGLKGRDITHFYKYINIDKAAVQNLMKLNRTIALRGEIIIPLQIYNEKYKKSFAHPRLLSTQVNKKYINNAEEIKIFNDLNIVFYEVLDGFKSFSQFKDYVKKENIKLDLVDSYCDTIDKETFISGLKYLYENQTEYLSDGIVLKEITNSSFTSQKNPDNQIAVKFQETQVETTVISVEWQISRQFRLKPVVYIQPVDIDGVTVKKATGHNAKFIQEYQIGKGSKILIVRSGSVIPQIVAVLSSTQADFPKDVKYKWQDENDIGLDQDQISQTDKNQVVSSQIHHVFHKMTIKGMGLMTVTNIIQSIGQEVGINDVFDFMQITENMLNGLQGFAETKIQNTLNQIKELKQGALQDPVLFISVLPLQNGLAYKSLKSIFDSLQISILDFLKLSDKQLYAKVISISGFGETKAQFIVQFRQQLEKTYTENDFMQEIVEHQEKQKEYKGQKKQKIQNIQKDKDFYELHFLMSGTRDSGIQEAIKRKGGYLLDGYSKKVDVLVVLASKMTNITAKLQKAIDDQKMIYIVIQKDLQEITFQIPKKHKIFKYNDFIQ